MKKRDFAKFLKSVTTKGRLDIAKITQQTDALRRQAVEYIVRLRGPVVVELIPASMDQSWLSACGYLYRTRSKAGYTFLHTCETRIQ